MRNARFALCINRYVRQEMIIALFGTPLGQELVSETETLCRPSDCAGRGRIGEVCKRHEEYHYYSFYGHCDAYGKIIHLQVSICRFDDDCR